ncbi:unnamed protein product [Spirodela intermedia]|uniref:RING-type domain-containing protein n=1 Tax=Spirodela intermedia TaxID=51605 RepID=A0A7I8KJE1_SPIIN|nr:unnamed protein product [Spirodela intermedia]
MGSDAAAANATGPAVSKDLGGKKKKANRSAKLKQCKLDARREQWLSQVKNKSCKVVNVHASPSPASPLPLTLPQLGKQNAPVGRSRMEENDQTMRCNVSDLDSMENSSTACASGKNSSRKECLSSRIDDKEYSGASCDPEDDEEDEEDIIQGEGVGEGSLDDWEAVADILTASDGGQSPLKSADSIAIPESTASRVSQNGDGILRKPEPERRVLTAWRSDDVFRPQSLPNLRKQHSFSLNTTWYRSQRTVGWAHHGINSQPSSCPICYEELDPTDSSFLPCCCGFRLCLFCHKRILEADGRCPGCRKQYDPVGNGDMGVSGGVPLLSLSLSRTCSMSSRS